MIWKLALAFWLSLGLSAGASQTLLGVSSSNGGGGGSGGGGGPTTCTTVPSGLIGCWPLDTATTVGATTNDNSGLGHNGTLINSPTLVPGQIQQAVSLDGTTQYVSLPDAALPATQATFSLTGWFATTHTGGSSGPAGAILNRMNVAGTLGYSMFIYNAHLYCQINGNLFGPTAPDFGDGLFHFAVCTFDGTNVVTYVDNVQYATGTSSAPSDPGTGTGNIGNDLQHAQTFIGDIDDPRIYNRALTPTEIGQIYTAGLSHISTSQRSKDLINALGVNTHIYQGGSIYSTTNITSDFTYLGIQPQARDYPLQYFSASAAFNTLAGAGLKFDFNPAGEGCGNVKC